jgi:hypothetical protein
VCWACALSGSIPYSFTWTLSGISNRNLTYAQLYNPSGNVVQASTAAVLSAVADLAGSTTGQYLLCTDATPLFALSHTLRSCVRACVFVRVCSSSRVIVVQLTRPTPGRW